MNEIREKLARILLGAIRSEKDPVDLEGKDLVVDLGINSIDALEILINVEIQFGIEVADEDLSQDLVSSLDTLESYVKERLVATG